MAVPDGLAPLPWADDPRATSGVGRNGTGGRYDDGKAI
ncbi:hypothetical protein BN2364_0920 [Alloalcanivorax xenomutans]|nr:hypothetical protein BN2364_0920 [Alloalcanivorax xenomutans]